MAARHCRRRQQRRCCCLPAAARLPPASARLPAPRSIILLYWSVAFVALSGHLKWWRLRGRRNDVLAW